MTMASVFPSRTQSIEKPQLCSSTLLPCQRSASHLNQVWWSLKVADKQTIFALRAVDKYCKHCQNYLSDWWSVVLAHFDSAVFIPCWSGGRADILRICSPEIKG